MTLLHADILTAIAGARGREFTPRRVRPQGGGCINRAYVVEDDSACYFLKLNDQQQVAMFSAEADGLRALRATGAVRVPEPLCWGQTTDGDAFLVTEWLPLRSLDDGAGRLLGERLATLHACLGDKHGWHRDNFIGATPQPNSQCTDWAEFWTGQRLGHQLDLAARQFLPTTVVDRGRLLSTRIAGLFDGYDPAPSLLHGDLWSGNCAAGAGGEPVVFDPAVYFGDRETDLAMTELFGGFGAGFYSAYRTAWPLDAGYGARKRLYQLYHLLNHCNLFGGSYAAQVGTAIEHLLAELG